MRIVQPASIWLTFHPNTGIDSNPRTILTIVVRVTSYTKSAREVARPPYLRHDFTVAARGPRARPSGRKRPASYV